MKVIENEYFNVLINLEKVTDYVRERRSIKHRLLEGISSALGRSYRTAKKVAAVIDEIAYKASDRGFSFNGRETLAEKVGVSLRTVDNAIKLLKISGCVYVGYRENPNSNGAKTPVIIFKEHTNYKRIAAILKLPCEEVCEEVCEVEKSETLSQGKSRGLKKVSTNSYLKQEKDNIYTKPLFEKIIEYLYLKISDASQKNNKGITYLSSYIDKVITNEEKNAYYKAKKTYHTRLKKEREAIKNMTAPNLNWLTK